MPAYGADGASTPATRVRADRLRWLALVFIAALTLARSADLFLVPLLRADVFQGDLDQHVWWTARFADPELFPNDITAEFFSQPLTSPYGYQLTYRLLVLFADPQQIAEAIPFVLTGCVVVLAFLLGRCASGAFLGGLIGVLLVLFWEPRLQLLGSGLQRSFALPVLMLGTWALAVRRHTVVGLALVVGALTYPSVFLNVAALALVVVSHRWWTERRAPEHWVGLIAGAALAVAVLVAAYVSPWPPGFGPLVTADQARLMPEFSPQGRLKVFFDHPIESYFSPYMGIDYTASGFVWAAAAVVWSTLAFPKLIRFEAWALVGTSFVLFVLARVFLFVLYFPNRYVKYSLPVFVLFWLPPFVVRLGRALDRWSVGATLHSAPRRHLVAVALIGLGGLVLYTGAVARHVVERIARPRDASLEDAYRFLTTLPKDMLIAAHPSDANDIPLRARRSVLASKETALPYLLGYYRTVAERLQAEVVAYYASTFDEVEALHARYGVGVVLVNGTRFSDRRPHLFAPFTGTAQMLLERGQQSGFALLNPPPERVLFRNGDYWVVRLGEPGFPPPLSIPATGEGQGGGLPRTTSSTVARP